MLGRLIILCSLLVFCGQAAALTIYKYVDKNGVVTYSDQAAPGAQVFVYPEAGHAFNRDVDPHHFHAGSAVLARRRTLDFLLEHTS